MVPSPTTAVLIALMAAGAACLAAFIAGAFSLVGLLISKEQQVSGFRQAWIDELRSDVGVFVAHAHQIQSFVVGHQPLNYQKFWEATRDSYIELNKASIRIKLRLNPTERESSQILQSMSEMEALFNNLAADPQSSIKISSIALALERDAPPLLKKEWERVKRGEPIYRLAKWMALSLFVATGATVIWLFSEILR
jgi:hypothetical protein